MDEFMKYWKPELDYLGLRMEKEDNVYVVWNDNSDPTYAMAEYPKERMSSYIGGVIGGWVLRDIKG